MSLAKDASNTANPLISDIQWEPFGGVRSWQMPLNTGAKLQERVYDPYGRLVRYPLGSVVRDITYDAADRIASYTHLDAATGQVTAEAQALNQSFGYDELGRLTSITTPSASWTIGYDANGNRTGVTLNGAASTYSTEATSNRLSGISNPTRSFGYDAAGNTLSDTGIAYTASYGLDNRLATLTKAGATTSFNYDAAGQRVRKVTGASKSHFVYDQDGQLLGEYNSTGSALQEFVWLGGTLIAVLTNSTTTEPRVYYAYSDHLNAPRVIVNAAGDVRWKWFSEPFGTAVPETIPNSLENLVVNLRFPGQYFDKESGLSYNYFRDYDGTVGRYVQSDPIGLGGGINTYAYVGGNPLSLTDPTGLQTAGGGSGGSSGPCFDFDKFADQVEKNRSSTAADLAAIGSAGAVGTMPKTPGELRGLGVPSSELNPYTSQLSRFSSRLGVRELRTFGRTVGGMALSTAATAALVFDGFYNWGVIGKAAWDATSSGGSCGCGSK
ncbi:MAG: RHS repeat protein [Mitsuaria chitosanitabida]|uniref:RHS repeat-associated core domain-containing protein n=1 Tax=Roseateles chitosanitabidus TaxID=65048 RepID=UPI001B04A073|nr:RHS repeat-associated core domain-containing protein [Roseateles chitosanitabidus]MBO9689390.1 RHS repeat protein [Roseateles chitosanitabidus]